eukprot:359977-Chlamydomonas_euryale.AAC.1
MQRRGTDKAVASSMRRRGTDKAVASSTRWRGTDKAVASGTRRRGTDDEASATPTEQPQARAVGGTRDAAASARQPRVCEAAHVTSSARHAICLRLRPPQQRCHDAPWQAMLLSSAHPHSPWQACTHTSPPPALR